MSRAVTNSLQTGLVGDVSGFAITEPREPVSKEAKAEYLYSELGTYTATEAVKPSFRTLMNVAALQTRINQRPFCQARRVLRRQLVPCCLVKRDSRQKMDSMSLWLCIRKRQLYEHIRTKFMVRHTFKDAVTY